VGNAPRGKVADRWTEVTSVARVASLVGTVGAFFGVQVGAVGERDPTLRTALTGNVRLCAVIRAVYAEG
jgi:hypothetical protein